MFGSLSDNLSKIFSKLTGKGFLKEEDVDLALREIRMALLEADVSLAVAKEFTKKIKEQALGQEIIKSVSPGQMVVKIVNDCLVELLTHENNQLNFSTTPPAVMMMVGLQGAGKTTICAKIANKYKVNKKILLASLDVYRPAAKEQLAVLAKTANVSSLEIIANESPLETTKRALKEAKLQSYDLLILDTAGRLHIDDELMDELIKVKALAKPIETLLVADSLTGQDAVNVAKNFNEKVGITGIILTRIDGDSRGGAALSMSFVTNCPIKLLGTGEKLSELEEFHADRIASRILGMGDIVSLVEKASEVMDQKASEKMMEQIKKGQFDLNHLADQLKNMNKMGGIGSIIGMIPGLGGLKDKIADAKIDDKMIARQLAIISSMTKMERRNPKILNASRKIRIANGSGMKVSDVNRLLKQHMDMANMFKRFGGMDQKSMMRAGIKNLFN
jgi:signal recognition particle subunit SRP54